MRIANAYAPVIEPPTIENSLTQFEEGSITVTSARRKFFMPSIPGQYVGKFKLHHHPGSGGMGVVYKAGFRDELVAVKVFPQFYDPDLDAKAAKRYNWECESLASHGLPK